MVSEKMMKILIVVNLVAFAICGYTFFMIYKVTLPPQGGDLCNHIAVYDKTSGQEIPKCNFEYVIMGNPMVRQVNNTPCWYGTRNCIVTVVGLGGNYEIRYKE